MKFIFAVLILLCMPLTIAAIEDAPFIAVVGANAPNTDVITAANFAANMKLEADATFTGATDEQFQDLSTTSIAQKTVVIIDGKNIEIVVGEEAPSAHNVVAQRSLSYFKTLGFETTLRMREDFNPDFVVVENERTDEPAVIVTKLSEPIVECTGCLVADECYAIGDIVELQYCDGDVLQALKGNGDECQEDYECLTSCANGFCGQELPQEIEVAEPELLPQEDATQKANPIIRFFAWFTGLFS